jgi:hypothetical protein
MTNLKNKQSYLDNIWDWTPYNKCFLYSGFTSNKCTFSDIDAAFERYGKFLYLETKSPGVELKTGQCKLLEAINTYYPPLRGTIPNATIFYIWGEPNKPTSYQLAGTGKTQECNVELLQKLFYEWHKGVVDEYYDNGEK